jgi:hypothetical protein
VTEKQKKAALKTIRKILDDRCDSMGMESRTLYFLRDSVTKKFYTNAGLQLGKFDRAVIHTTEASVVAGIKKRCTICRGDDKAIYLSENGKAFFAERRQLPDWGIEIVPVVVDVN